MRSIRRGRRTASRSCFVGNAEIAWGSGDLWQVSVDKPAQPSKILSEETSWSARPDIAPDGKRVLFASYHGRQTHQLWLTTIAGAAPLPLTFGDRRKAQRALVARWPAHRLHRQRR